MSNELARIDPAIDFDWTASSPFDNPAAPTQSKMQAELALELPLGSYRAEWVNTRTGKPDKIERLNSSGGIVALTSPVYSQDIALGIKRLR